MAFFYGFELRFWCQEVPGFKQVLYLYYAQRQYDGEKQAQFYH